MIWRLVWPSGFLIIRCIAGFKRAAARGPLLLHVVLHHPSTSARWSAWQKDDAVMAKKPRPDICLCPVDPGRLSRLADRFPNDALIQRLAGRDSKPVTVVDLNLAYECACGICQFIVYLLRSISTDGAGSLVVR